MNICTELLGFHVFSIHDNNRLADPPQPHNEFLLVRVPWLDYWLVVAWVIASSYANNIVPMNGSIVIWRSHHMNIIPDHSCPLRGGLMQGWESECGGLGGIPLTGNKNSFHLRFQELIRRISSISRRTSFSILSMSSILRIPKITILPNVLSWIILSNSTDSRSK